MSVQTSRHLSDTILHRLESSKQLTNDDLTVLYTLHSDTLLAALDLIDKSCVIKITCPSGRTIYHLPSTKHWCLPSAGYCSCPSFIGDVIGREEALMCVHLLAAEIAGKINKCVEKKLDDGEFAEVMFGIVRDI